MTENEAIKELHTSIDLAKMCTQNSERKREVEAYEMAIKALEEIQQYRAIGTVDQCSKAMDIVKTMIERDMEPVEMEVLQAYIHFENELVDKGFTVKSLLEAAEKMKPKKPIILERKFQNGDEVCTNWKCPICGLNVIEEPPCQEYCQRCGNKLDWSE